MSLAIYVFAAFIAVGIIALPLFLVHICRQRRHITEKEETLRTILENDTDFIGDKFAPPEILDHDNWAYYEQSWSGLEQVIVLADTVEAPINGLQKAVFENFKRGVHYCFIVSNSKAEAELKGFYGLFEALANAAITKHGLKFSKDQLISIHRLPDEWDNVPYVFYRMAEKKAGVTRVKTIAFRGDKERAGIADRYIAVDQDSAEALFKLLMGKPPEELGKIVKSAEKDHFVDPSVVIRRSEVTSRLN